MDDGLFEIAETGGAGSWGVMMSTQPEVRGVLRRGVGLVVTAATALTVLGFTPGDALSASVGVVGGEGNGPSEGGSISADGRRVVFVSDASNLVPGDTNGIPDTFVRDLATGTTKRVSVSSSGGQANGVNSGSRASISADGRFVAFTSDASNLVAGDTNGANDVFVRDLATGVTRRVSVSSGGAQGNAPSTAPTISGDGHLVAFASWATNLVAGDTNRHQDIFVHNLATGRTRRMSLSSAGAQTNNNTDRAMISADGRFVAFISKASNLVAGDTNRKSDVFVRNRAKRTTRRVNVSSRGAQANNTSTGVAITPDGRFVAFSSLATNLAAGAKGLGGVYVRNRAKAVTRLVSVFSAFPAISADGRIVAYSSHVHCDCWQAYVRNRITGTTRPVGVSSSGVEADNETFVNAISATGGLVVFSSTASNLVPGDTNGVYDVFIRDVSAGTTVRVSVP